MDFVKKNLISVIAIAVAVIGIPVMLYFSSGLAASNRESLESGVNKAMGILNNSRVTYESPATTQSGETWSVSTEPSNLRNGAARDHLQALVERSTTVLSEIDATNSAGKALLVDTHPQYGDYFPQPVNDSAKLNLNAVMIVAYPDAHDELLEDAGVRGAPPAEVIESQVEAQRTRLVQRIIARRVEQSLSEEELEQVRTDLGAFRAQIYRDYAADTTFFATPAVFSGVERLDPVNGPRLLTVEKAWDWQHRTWIHQDVIAALVSANTDDGERLSVLSAPVKRVVAVEVQPMPAPANQSPLGFSQDDGSGGAAPAPASLATPVPLDYTQAHTGLAAWPARPNAMYDTRDVTLRMIVDGDRVAEVVEAISTTNLMKVVEMDFREFDDAADYRAGFDYGPGQTVALTLRVQTVWLRSWTKQYIPPAVRTQMGIPADAPAAANDLAAADAR